MCGILGLIVGKEGLQSDLVAFAESQSQRQTHRGPDERGSHQIHSQVVLCHERLSIVDLSGGKQPLVHVCNSHQLCSIVNGEIYNHQAIRSSKISPEALKLLYTRSDSEAVASLYLNHLVQSGPSQFGEEEAKTLMEQLDGMFAFVLVDVNQSSSNSEFQVLIGRDPIGIKPLYVGYVCHEHQRTLQPNCSFSGDNIAQIWFASELKSLTQCCHVEECPNGHFSLIKQPLVGEQLTKLNYIPYYTPNWYSHPSPIAIHEESQAIQIIQELLTKAVEKRMMADVEVGVFLSGGLDSSITTALCKQYIQKHSVQGQLHSFCVGLEESPDILHAREMAEHLGTVHHERIFTVEEGLHALDQVIYHLETFDVPLLCSAVPQFFISELASKFVKVILTGEGADELFAGYVHFGQAASSDELRKECKILTKQLGLLNLRRCDRMTMGFSLEARVPFLDVELIETVFSMDAELFTHSKNPLRPEKALLRKAFGHLLTENVTNRTKLMFSEGVGDQWTKQLTDHCSAQVSDEQFSQASHIFPSNPPSSKTEFYVRNIYEKHFGVHASGLVSLWKPGESYTSKLKR